MRKTILGVLLLCAARGPAAHADWIADLKSPVTTEARWILLSGTGATLAVLATHHDVEDPFEKFTVEHKPLGSTSKFGDLMGQWVPNLAYTGGVLIAHAAGNRFGYYRAKLMLESTLYAGLIATVLKFTVREPRPYDSSVRTSFPSGHSATAFAFAGVIAAEHGWWWGAPAMALATFVGYSRINDYQHHVHDVVAGATIGLTAAYGIYFAQKPEREALGERVMLMPLVVPGGAGLTASLSF